MYYFLVIFFRRQYKLIMEFLRFFYLKQTENDQDALILSPSWIIDSLWHFILEDKAIYANFCKGYECYFKHRFEGATETLSKAKAYKKFFGCFPPDDIWWSTNELKMIMTNLIDREYASFSTNGCPQQLFLE